MRHVIYNYKTDVMKSKYIFIFLLLFIFNPALSQDIARVENVIMQSKALNQEREILVYTPADYDLRIHEHFNVIYVFDSQIREFFDYTTSIVSFLTNGDNSFIVVGITSPFNEELDYSRINDFLPILETESTIARFGLSSGNADNFLNYISEEVMPYINSNYITLNHNIAIGHSLGATFILYSFLQKPNLFGNYIAISPNLANDEGKLGNQLINFDYTSLKNPTFIYLSNADEGVEYWKDWKPIREKVYSYFKNSLKGGNIAVEIGEFPNETHWNTFPPSLNKALDYYFKNIQGKQEKELSREEYEVAIRVKVPKKEDVIYITGNQPNLGDWNPEKIKMKKISDFEREISVKLKSPAQFKFTRGNWESEAVITGTYRNVIIKPELKKTFDFEILHYYDRYEE